MSAAGILKLVLALISLASAVTSWARERALMQAGEEKAIADAHRRALAKITAADKARAAADARNVGSGLREDDGYRRPD